MEFRESTTSSRHGDVKGEVAEVPTEARPASWWAAQEDPVVDLAKWKITLLTGTMASSRKVGIGHGPCAELYY